jgi:hypothetical protein
LSTTSPSTSMPGALASSSAACRANS